MDKKPLLSSIKKLPPLKKGTLPSGSGFIALGPGRSSTPDASTSMKREASLPALSSQLKKARFGATTDSIKSATPIKKDIIGDSWLTIAVEIPIGQIADDLAIAERKENFTRIESLVCGVLKRTSDHKFKIPDPYLTTLLSYWCCEKANVYLNYESVLEALCSIMRKPSTSLLKVPTNLLTMKLNPLVCSIVCNALISILEVRKTWPDSIVKVYLEDALSERSWVDRPECGQLVQLIEKAFCTMEPSKDSLNFLLAQDTNRLSTPGDISSLNTALQPSFMTSVGGSQSPFASFEDRDIGIESVSEDSLVIATTAIGSTEMDSSTGAPPSDTIGSRFLPVAKWDVENVRRYTVEMLRDFWSRRQEAVSKNLVKTMSVCCGFYEVRLAASQKLDAWIQNPKLQKSCIELMLYVACNCNEAEPTDQEAITNILKMRLLKSKPLTGCFCAMIRELIKKNEHYLKFIVKLSICNELLPLNARSPNNMLILNQCFTINQILFTKNLADVFYEFLIDKDDHLRNVRLLLREIVKSALKYEFSFVAFCEVLCAEKAFLQDLHLQIKERLYHSIEDLLCMSILLGITPSIKEAAISLSRLQDKKDLSLVRNFQQQCQTVQKVVLSWLQNIVPNTFRPSKEDYIKTFTRIMFLDKADYYNKDGWPSEQERTLYLKTIQEAPISEDILMKICLIGLLPNLSLPASHALELIDQIVRKVATAHIEGKFSNEPSPISISRLEFIDLLISCANYRVPDGTGFPAGYSPPHLAISVLKWRVFNTLILLAAYNSQSVGRILWNEYPTVKMMIKMLMIDDFTFPPSSDLAEGLSSDTVRLKDLQVMEMEKQEILELENYLAAASTKQLITESNSHLISQLMRSDPKGPCRRPTQSAVEQLKLSNQQFHLGLQFCKCRDPDFLLEVINTQSASQSLPWLIQLIQKNEGSLSVLPIQCLCEFMLYQIEMQLNIDDGEDYADCASSSTAMSNLFNEKRISELKHRLRSVLWSSSMDDMADEETFLGTLTYFAKRLQSETAKNRYVASKALFYLTQPENCKETPKSDNESIWLTNITLLPFYSSIREDLCKILIKCCLTETEPDIAQGYFTFLERQAKLSAEICENVISCESSVKNLAEMICERSLFFNRLMSNSKHDVKIPKNSTQNFLMEIFANYSESARQPQQREMSWTSNQQQLLVQWGEMSAIQDVRIVSASLLLLSYDVFINFSDDCKVNYERLKNLWFPTKAPFPVAFMIDTMEEAELIPDWVKIKLLRCQNDHIIDSVLNVMDDSQIVNCVQTFGLSMKNAGKILKILDNIANNESRRDLILSNQLGKDRLKTLMGFVTAYQKMGAQNGQSFVEKFSTEFEETASKYMDFEMESKNMKVVQQPVKKSIDNLLTDIFSCITSKILELPQFSTLLLRLAENPHQNIIKVAKFLENHPENFPHDFLKSDIDEFCLLFCTMRHHCPEKDRESLQNSLSAFIDRFGSNLTYQEKDSVKKSIISSSDSLEAMEVDYSQYDSNVQNYALIREQDCNEQFVRRLFVKSSQNTFCHQSLFSIPHKLKLEILKKMADILLKRFEHDYDAKTCVQFLSSLMDLPRLSKGRDPKLPRHYVQEEILNLTLSQTKTLLEYLAQLLNDSTNIQTASSKSKRRLEKLSEKDNFHLVEQCRDILSICLGKSGEKTKKIACWLGEKAKSCSEFGFKVLLVEFYFQHPSIVDFVKIDLNYVPMINVLLKSRNLAIDVVLDRLINALFKLASSADSDVKMDEINAMLRRLVFKHPALFLRQLPLIGALLRGHMAYTKRVYLNTNYLLLFTMIFGFFDLLKHYLCCDEISALEDIADSFFEFVEAHALRNARLVGLIDKLISVLNNYHESTPEKASVYLNANSSILQALSIRYPEIPSLKSLMNRGNFGLPPIIVQSANQNAAGAGGQSSASADPSSDQVAGVESLRPSQQRPPSPVQLGQVAPWHNRLSKPENVEEIIRVLKEILDFSSIKPDVLSFFQNQLEQLIFHKSKDVCRLAFEVLMKLFNFSPCEADHFLPIYLRCFSLEAEQVSLCAMEVLPDYCRINPRNTSILLECAEKYCSTNISRENLRILCKTINDVHHNVLYVNN